MGCRRQTYIIPVQWQSKSYPFFIENSPHMPLKKKKKKKHITMQFPVILIYIHVCSCAFSVSVSQSTWARLVARWAMPAGNYTVWNTVSSPMVRCQATRPSEAVMTPSIPSSVRLGPVNTSPGSSLSIWNQT